MHYFLAEVEQCLHAFMYFKLVMGYHVACLTLVFTGMNCRPFLTLQGMVHVHSLGISVCTCPFQEHDSLVHCVKSVVLLNCLWCLSLCKSLSHCVQ